MKKERIAALALCAILLCAVIWQGTALSALRAESENLRANLEAVQATAASMQAEQDALAQSQGRIPRGWFAYSTVDATYRTLSAQFQAELPGCTETTVFVQAQTANRFNEGASLTRNADGLYIGRMDFYDITNPHIPLTIALEDGTVLYQTDSLAAVLPLQMDWGSGSTAYNANNQALYLAEWSVRLTDLLGEEVEASGGVYRLYQNGTPVFEGPCYAPDGGRQLEGEGFLCAGGDYFELRYLCTDSFGLRYEFPLEGFLIQNGKLFPSCPETAWPELTWPN